MYTKLKVADRNFICFDVYRGHSSGVDVLNDRSFFLR